MDGDHPLLLSGSLQVTDRPAMIKNCCFSSCGQFLACAASDSTVYTVRMPLSLKNNQALVGEGSKHCIIVSATAIQSFYRVLFLCPGHNESVLCAGFSQSSEWLVSCSTDKTIRVWSLTNKEPQLTISTDKVTSPSPNLCVHVCALLL